MLTPELNERITRVGPGTPCGSLLRRYWHPLAAASELTAERPKKRVRVFGEDLVLYRTGTGEYGLVGEHCSHRGTSLYYGFLEDGGLRCPYHGWLYDSKGRCIEQPFEPAQSMMKHAISHPAYPVQKLAGLLFAYMGPPDRQPLLPRWDILVWQHGTRHIQVRPVLNCNWFQAEENTADFVHTFFLHGQTIIQQGRADEVGFFTRAFARYGFQPCPWGIIKTWEYEGERADAGWGNLVLFPNMLRQTDVMSTIHWRVPIDDTHTTIFQLTFRPSPDGRPITQAEDPPVDYEASWIKDDGEYHMQTFSSQDGMAWETQGAICDRSRERLGHSDRGIAMLREMLLAQIDLVERGGDPMALIWDSGQNECVNLEGWASERTARTGARTVVAGVPRKPKEEVFDDGYEVFEVPFGAARPRPTSPVGTEEI